MSVKEIFDKRNGKTKYEAQVWHDGQFYGSRRFDLRALAQTWHDEQLKLAESHARERQKTPVASKS